MASVTIVTFSQGFGPLALAPMFPQLMEAFDASLADVVKFTGVCILVLGFSNFFWYYYLSQYPGIYFSSNCLGSQSKLPSADDLS